MNNPILGCGDNVTLGDIIDIYDLAILGDAASRGNEFVREIASLWIVALTAPADLPADAQWLLLYK